MAASLALEHRDLTQQAYDVLKVEILNRRFRPNERLSVDRIARLLGVSRTPLTDALNRLAGDGLITIAPRVGSFVTPVSIRDVNEVFSVRKLVELHAAEQGIGQMGANRVRNMRELVAKMATCIDGNRYHPEKVGRFMELDHKLHGAIVQSAGNERLAAIYEDLQVHSYIARIYFVRELANAIQGQAEHEAIVEACANQDIAMLKAALDQHITDVQRLVVAHLESAGGVM